MSSGLCFERGLIQLHKHRGLAAEKLQRDLVSSLSLPRQTDHRFSRGGSWISFLV